MIRRTPGRKLALLALASMLALGMAACGDDDGGDAADETTTTEAEVQGSDTIQITYRDFAYEVSGPLTAGGTIELENAGKEIHMMGLLKLNAGKTLKDVQTLLEQESGGGDEGGGQEGGDEETTTTAGDSSETTAAEGGGEEEDPFAELGEDPGLPGNVMTPGAAAAITLPDLEPGKYAIVCFIPSEGDGAPHFVKGMINEFDVVEGDAPAAPTPDATYKVAKGKAIEGPATLTPGKHTIKFEAVGDAADLEPGIGRFNPGTTPAAFDKALNDLFESEGGPPKGAAAKIPGEITFSGHDLQSVTSFFLTVDFEPGTWYLTAEDSDVENDLTVPKEFLQIKVA